MEASWSTTAAVFFSRRCAELITALERPARARPSARLTNALNTANNNLDNALDVSLTVQASIGAYAKEIDTNRSAAEDLAVQFDQTLSGLQDLDYAKAVSDLTFAQVSLQAAQKSFVQVQGSFAVRIHLTRCRQSTGTGPAHSLHAGPVVRTSGEVAHPARLVVAEGLDDLLTGVHHERAVTHDRLVDGLGRERRRLHGAASRVRCAIRRARRSEARPAAGAVSTWPSITNSAASQPAGSSSAMSAPASSRTSQTLHAA